MNKELQEILISAVALAIAFSIASHGGIPGIFSLDAKTIIISFVSVSLGFIVHELCHRFVARFYGAYAEYRMWKTGIWIAMVSSFFGFIFAAPGAVYIYPKSGLWGGSISRSENGIISISGPVANVVIALAFFLADKAVPLGEIAAFGVSINLWLAFFNMIPIPPLDGSKVLRWDPTIWGLAIAVLGLLVFI